MSRQDGPDDRPHDDRAGCALAQWRRERPDLDPEPMALFGRLAEAALRARRDHLEPLFASAGLRGGEFDVLATLRRAGAPHALSPTALYEATMVTSGAMTGRIDRLERAGLVRRERDPADRRGVLVALTEEGLALIDGLVGRHVARQARLLEGLTPDERRQLSALLGKLLDGLGPPPDPG